ncbi:hypothetical protein HL42_1668 [Trichophyton rubrum]|nr:hypothetical protein HL42_1668 [Trichophyton rubrum]
MIDIIYTTVTRSISTMAPGSTDQRREPDRLHSVNYRVTPGETWNGRREDGKKKKKKKKKQEKKTTQGRGKSRAVS